MNRSKALTWTELRVGVVTIVSLIVLAVTIVYVGSGGGSPFAKTYELKALMSDINGLKPGAPVRVGGLEVGTVKHVDFDQKGGMVQVTMKLARRVQPRVTTKSEANLGSLGLLGEKAVDITSSTEGAPIEDNFGREAQYVRSRRFGMGPILIAALSHHIPEQHTTLGSIQGVIEEEPSRTELSGEIGFRKIGRIPHAKSPYSRSQRETKDLCSNDILDLRPLCEGTAPRLAICLLAVAA